VTSDSNRWRGRPLLAAALRLAIVAVPLLIGYGASVLAARLLAHHIAQTRWWLVVVVAVSLVVCFGVERVTRRFLPLAALLKLSMLFPDQAPKRLKLARGAVSTKLLNERVATARTSDAAAVAESVLELITALTAHDRRTRGHSERVRMFTELLADELHLPREDRDKLRWAALLHDVGKLQVAPEILNKPAKLSNAEFELVAQHPVNGEELLGPLVEWLGEWGTAVRQHHEQYDGSGYPDQLAGSEIGRAARMISITDSFEVMTAHRAYKKPMATINARTELARCAGTQFDPVYVRAFLSVSLPRLLWAMGPGALAMNLPLLRLLADTTNKGLLAIPQGAVVAGAAAVVIGGASTVAPISTGTAPTPGVAAGPVAGAHGHSHAGSTPGGGGPATGGPVVLGPVPPDSDSGGSSNSGAGAAGGSTAISTGSSAPSASSSADSTTPTAPTVPVAPASVSGVAAPAAPVAPVGPAAPNTPAAPVSSTAAAPGGGSSPAAAASSPAPSMAAPTLLSKPPASGVLPTVQFTWAQVAGLSYEYQLDSGGWTVLGATNSFSAFELTGTHTFKLRARNGGSGSPTPTTSYTFTVLL
jgi:hypothetical protein